MAGLEHPHRRGAGKAADWSRARGLPVLGEMGHGAGEDASLAEASLAASSMKANPVMPVVADLVAVLEAERAGRPGLAA
ncbi:MAG: hypothetical protein AAFS07_19375, partial [Pseudomonadota bacterium]